MGKYKKKEGRGKMGKQPEIAGMQGGEKRKGEGVSAPLEG